MCSNGYTMNIDNILVKIYTFHSKLQVVQTFLGKRLLYIQMYTMSRYIASLTMYPENKNERKE